LARNVTELVHGRSRMLEAEEIGHALFSGDLEALTEAQLDEACRTMPTTPFAEKEIAGFPVIELLARTGLAASKREGRDLLAAGAVSINGRRVEGVNATLAHDAVRFGRFVILRKGKKQYHAVTVGEAAVDGRRQTADK